MYRIFHLLGRYQRYLMHKLYNFQQEVLLLLWERDLL